MRASRAVITKPPHLENCVYALVMALIRSPMKWWTTPLLVSSGDLLTLLGGEDLTEDVFKIIDAEDDIWVGNLSHFTLRVHSTCVVGGWRVWVHMCVGMAIKGRAYLLSIRIHFL